MSHCLAPTVPDSRQGVLRRGRSLVAQDPGWRQAGSLQPYQAAAAHHRSQRDRVAQPEAAQSLEKPRPFPTEQKPGQEPQPGGRLGTWSWPATWARQGLAPPGKTFAMKPAAGRQQAV